MPRTTTAICTICADAASTSPAVSNCNDGDACNPNSRLYDPQIAANPDLAPQKLVGALDPYTKNTAIFHCPSNPKARTHACSGSYSANGSPNDNVTDPYYSSYRFYNSRTCGEVPPVLLDADGMMARLGYGCGDVAPHQPVPVGPSQISH